ncbi:MULTISPECIES: hypothetical protein, partial [Campylobacter]|uniref:hypothetical protein n=1 Tax=Campylobacter TaxID=194 RepID=UPI0023F517A4
GVFKMVGRFEMGEFLSGKISVKLKVGAKIKEKEITILIGKDGFTPISFFENLNLNFMSISIKNYNL